MKFHSRQRRQEDVAALTSALSKGQLWVAYQPILRLDAETIVGTEALLRWSHPEHGLIPPDQFIGTAEESGLILPIGEFVLRDA